MTKSDEILTAEDLRLLADIGFIAASRGLTDQADVIFKGVRTLRPRQEAGFVGGAMVQILASDPRAAVAALENAPVTAATRTFLGIALIQEGNTSKGKTMLQSVVKMAPGTPFAQLANTALSGAPVKEGRARPLPSE